MNNRMFNLNHKSDHYLMDNYEEHFENHEWNNDDINFDDNIIINDDYIDYSYNKTYSFLQKKGSKFKQTKYK